MAEGRTCQHPGCSNEGEECFLPDWGDGPPSESEWFCYDHAHQHGFCWNCGGFFGGIESFDFGPDGLCDECRIEVVHDENWGEGYDEYLHDWADYPGDLLVEDVNYG